MGVLQRFRGEPKGRAQREWRFQPPIRLLFEQRDGTVWAGFGRQPHPVSGRLDGGLRQGTGPGLRAGDSHGRGRGRSHLGGNGAGCAAIRRRTIRSRAGPARAAPDGAQHARRRRRALVGADRFRSQPHRRDAFHGFHPVPRHAGVRHGWILEDDEGYFWIAGRRDAARFAGGPGCRCRRAQARRRATRCSAWPLGCEAAASFPSG